MGDTMTSALPPQTIEEREERIARIDERLAEIDVAYDGQQMPDGIRDEWNALNAERDEQLQVVRELRARKERLALIAATSPAAQERADVYPAASSTVTSVGSVASAYSAGTPTLIRRRGEEIYDIGKVRAESRDDEDFRRRLHDNARRAIERAKFGTIRGLLTVEQAQTNVDRLLDAIDDKHGTLAKRILATGSPNYERWFGDMIAFREPSVPRPHNALSIGAGDSAGLAVPFHLDPTIILTSDGSINPLRAIARVEQIVGNTWKGLTSQGISVTRATEGAQVSDNAPTLAQPEVSVERVHAWVPFSIEADQDWTQLRSEMTRMLQEAKEEEEASSFLLGNGTPPAASGLITTLSTTSDENDGFSAFTVENLYKLEEELPPRFRVRARWLANKKTYNLVRQLDTSGGAGLWVRLGAGQPAELLGYPAHEASHMPDREEDKRYLLFGDFQQFLILDRVGMDIELVPHVFGSNGRPTGQRGLYAIWRNNCEILVHSAFRALVNAT